MMQFQNTAMKESILYTNVFYIKKRVKHGKKPIKLFIAKLMKTVMNFYLMIWIDIYMST